MHHQLLCDGYCCSIGLCSIHMCRQLPNLHTRQQPPKLLCNAMCCILLQCTLSSGACFALPHRVSTASSSGRRLV